MIANQIQKRFCMKAQYEFIKITEELPWHEFLGGFGSFWKSSDFFMKYHEKSWNVWKFCRLSQNEKGEYEWQTFPLILQRPTIPVPVPGACALCLCLCNGQQSPDDNRFLPYGRFVRFQLISKFTQTWQTIQCKYSHAQIQPCTNYKKAFGCVNEPSFIITSLLVRNHNNFFIYKPWVFVFFWCVLSLLKTATGSIIILLLFYEYLIFHDQYFSKLSLLVSLAKCISLSVACSEIWEAR